MKKFLSMILIMAMAIIATSCGKEQVSRTEHTELSDLDKNVGKRKIAVAYFSINNDTRDVANKIAETLEVDVINIEPEEPYTKEDLDYENHNSRIYLESNYNVLYKEEPRAVDDYEPSYGMPPLATESEVEAQKINELPKIKKNDANMYDIIILGFPEWHEDAPKVIYTFVKDMKNKILVPFCVEGNMGYIDQIINEFVDVSVKVMSGVTLDKDVSSDEINEWITKYSVDFDL